MKRRIVFSITLACLMAFSTSMLGQAPIQGSGKSPTDVIERLWRMATAGYLLEPEGWQKASAFFQQPAAKPANDAVFVMSNYWGIMDSKVAGNAAEVIVDFEQEGQIDTNLRYVATPHHAAALGSGMEYKLSLLPTSGTMFAPDGKTIIRILPGALEWKIQGSETRRWTTVNTALRYVMEMREKTSDPIVKNNADVTVAALLRLP